MARTETLIDILLALRELGQAIPTAEDLAARRAELEELYRAEGRNNPERAEFWDEAATALGALLVKYWEDAHKSPTGDLEANRGAHAESGQLTTGRV